MDFEQVNVGLGKTFKNITHIYEAAPGSNLKLVIRLSFCEIKPKRKIFHTL